MFGIWILRAENIRSVQLRNAKLNRVGIRIDVRPGTPANRKTSSSAALPEVAEILNEWPRRQFYGWQGHRGRPRSIESRIETHRVNACWKTIGQRSCHTIGGAEQKHLSRAILRQLNRLSPRSCDLRRL